MAKLILKAPYYKPGHKTEEGRGRGGMLEYVATREGVELLRGGLVDYIGTRKGSCGLFSDKDVTINLKELSEEINEHRGNVWTLIFSLKREDAERLGYNTAEEWMYLLRSRRNDIAKEMNIDPMNFRWYAAYIFLQNSSNGQSLKQPLAYNVGNISHTLSRCSSEK